MKKTIYCMKIFMLSGLILTASFYSLHSQEVIAIKAKKIHTVTQGTITDGTILIRDGKIEGIGTNIQIPWNAKTIDYSQKIIIPGLIEAHAIRGYDIPNETNPLTPFVTVRDSIDPSDEDFIFALRYGITTLNILPGHETILGGTGAIVKPYGLFVPDMLLVPDSGMKISVSGVRGQTRMGATAQLRRYFDETFYHMSKKDKLTEPEKTVATPGSFRSSESVKYDAVADLLKGRYSAFIYCESPSDVIRADELAEEYKIEAIFVLGPECYKAADYIAQQKLPVILDPEILYYETHPITKKVKKIEVAGIFAKKGIPFALQSEPEKIHARSLLYQAMVAISQGLTPEQALKSITLFPSKILGIKEMAGSLEKGKLANFIVMDGNPFELSTKVEYVYIDGKLVYNREKDKLLQDLLDDNINP